MRTQQPLGLVHVVELPGLSKRLMHGCVQRLGQALDHIAGLVRLTALDWRLPTEGQTDYLGQCLRAVNDEQSAGLGIETALDQVVDECLTTATLSVTPSTRPSGCLLPWP